MISRYISASIFGLAVTTSLFYIMSTLIATGKNPFTSASSAQVVDFIRIKQDESIKIKDRKAEKPDKPETPPPVPKPKVDPFKLNTKLNPDFAFNPSVNIETNMLEAGEGDYLPIFKVQPVYPSRAQSRGIEGYVLLEFTVTKIGTCTDIRVIEAKPPGYFERSAIKAAQKFKYKPKVINGEPVDVAGVRNKITFVLEDD